MKWHELTDILHDFPTECICESAPNQKLYSLMYLTPVLSTLSSTVLYIGAYEDYQMLHGEAQTALSLILYAPSDYNVNVSSWQTQNILVLRDATAYKECFNFIQHFFAELQAMDEWLKELYQFMHSGATLPDIATQIAEQYQRPLNIVDSSYSVIAQSGDFSDYDPRLAEDNARGYIPPSIIKVMHISGKREQVRSSEPIIIEDYENGAFIHYNTPILSGNIPLGAFSIFLHPQETLTFAQSYFLPSIASILAIYLEKKAFFLTDTRNYCSGLLEALFNNQSASIIDIEHRMSVFGYQVLPHKYIITVHYNSSTYANTPQIVSALQTILKHSIHTTVENILVFLASYDADILHHDFQEVIDQMRNILDLFPDIHIGVSSKFDSLSDAKNAFTQARAAATTGFIYEPATRVYPFDDYRLEYMVYKLSETSDISLFSYSQLYGLLDYDKEHQTQLLYTLFVYIFCSGSKNIAYMCKTLNIHKNTLYFRLNKIKELTGLDYEKPTVVAMIIFTFALMRMNNYIDYSTSDL